MTKSPDWDKVPKFAGKWKGVKPAPAKPAAPTPAPGGFAKARYVPGVGALPAPKHYTGDKVLGVAVLHKSCLQPVFSQEAAIEVARMRRG